MTDDFHLFAPGDDAHADVDPDIALAVAYLSRELSVVQVVAVQERLATDAAFRAKVQPLIDGWALPGSWGTMSPASADAGLDRGSSLTRAEIEAGWQRRVAGAERTPITVLARRGKSHDESPTKRRMPMTRIAAVIALIVLPMVAVAQLVVYAANHVGAPGHEIARAITPSALVLSDRREGHSLPLTGDGQQAVPVIDLSAPTSKSTHVFLAITGFKETSDGRLLVNDVTARQLYLLDRSLTIVDVPLDSFPGSAKSWGRPPAGRSFFSYLGDSALISGGATMRVLDERGRVVRGLDLAFTGARIDLGIDGAFDSRGRPVFLTRWENNSDYWTLVPVPASDFIPAPPGPPGRSSRLSLDANGNTIAVTIDRPDSLAILRADLDARRVDTVAWYLRPVNQLDANTTSPAGGGRVVVRYGADGKAVSVRQVVNPLYTVDAWSVMSDGTIAIVRGRDYHVDWIHPDGTRSASPKLPFDWKAVTEADKQRLVDSTRACLDSTDAWAYPEMMRLFAQRDSEAVAEGRPGATLWVPPPAIKRPACFPVPPVGDRGFPQIRNMKYEIVPLAQIADYYPPILDRATRADRDGNLWILPRTTSLSRQGELVYDVVNEKQGMVRRVRLPLGRSIAAFGKGGVVYLQVGNMKDGFVLERYELPR